MNTKKCFFIGGNMAKENEKTKNVKKVKTVKKAKTKAPKESYLKGVKKEMKLVKWPTFKEVIKYTIATVIMCLVVCGFFLLLNLLLSLVKGWIN